jgi:hypothetical protein
MIFDIAQKMYDFVLLLSRMIFDIAQKMYDFVLLLSKMIGIYILWIILHYISAHLYTHLCVHLSFVGFITSPLIVASPHCIALRWMIMNGADSIQSMWILFGTWIISKIVLSKLTATETETETE